LIRGQPADLQCFNVSHFVEVPDLDGPVVGAAVERVRLSSEGEAGDRVSVAAEGVDSLQTDGRTDYDLPNVDQVTIVTGSLEQETRYR
jgi:hypothetical protein